MKLIFALLLCGLYCASASPDCDESKAYHCAGTKIRDNDHFYPTSEDDLEEFCRDIVLELDCQIDFTERCPRTLLGATRESLEQYREAFTKLCDANTPLRQKFLEKGACLNEEMEDAERRCQNIIPEQDWCKRFDLVAQCAEDKVNEVCGSDGEEVYAEIFRPKYALKKVFCGPY